MVTIQPANSYESESMHIIVAKCFCFLPVYLAVWTFEEDPKLVKQYGIRLGVTFSVDIYNKKKNPFGQPRAPASRSPLV